jgi:hypothetical protein|tara:strand:+ start:3702 stop:3926 length:225 start_codon:yes stop_codon:yes gene_type:complete
MTFSRRKEMQLFAWMKQDEDSVIVKTANSKGPGKPSVPITVADIRRGRVKDSNGYENEVVLFVRANKLERKGRK